MDREDKERKERLESYHMEICRLRKPADPDGEEDKDAQDG